MSSTNKRWEIDSCVNNSIPLRSHALLASWMSLLRASAINRNNNGERGNPFLRPHDVQKNLEGAPLIRTAKDTDWIHAIIQFTIRTTIPN
jgi:hypothetical protein